RSVPMNTSTVDQEIAQRKAELENIIAASAQEAVEQPPEEISQPVSGELASGIARVNELLNEALNCILKIQEISTAVQNFGQDQNMPPADAELVYVPVEEPTSDVSGVVTDSTGNPVEGATVIDPQSGVSTSTDSSGSYVIPLVPSGRFATFKVLKGGRQLSVGKVQLLPGRMAFADWQVGAGVKASGIKILPANVIIASKTGVGAAKSGSIKGVVRDVNGRPVARALVIVKGLGMARTDSQGRYMFVKVPPGNYQVMVRKGGSTIQTQRVSVAAKKVVESRTVFKSKTTMAPSLGTQAVLARSGGAMLKGNVGSTSRQPLPGAKVTAVCADGAVSVFSDVKGKYTFKGLRQGRYHLLANKAGYREASGTVFLKSAQGEVRDFTLEKSSAEIQKVLSVRPYPRAGGTRAVSRTTTKRIPVAAKGALCGVVLDAQSGKQIVSAIVQVYGQQTMRTDRKGRYRFSDLPSGTYRVAAGRKGYQQVSKTATIRPNITSKEDFSLKVKEPHALRTTTTPLLLKPTVKYGRVRGKITDSKTGKPMTQATITLLNRKTYSNASGAYSFDNIPAGSCTIIIKKSNYQDGSRRITVQAGRTISVDFRLAPKTGVRIEKRLVPYPVPLKKQ
ncbi:MAG TPA: carboxypeptidase regulatory-like domain-containing protein, partial [Geobacteraceae bacterium]|nr:carboxypeptidase regulatory-like domain-containing protein [Geobacteraceae bacterium]